jgi:hypothetical protein
VHQNNVGKRGIERGVGKWQLMSIGNFEFGVGDRMFSSQSSGALNLGLLRVYSDYFTWRQHFGKANAYRAGAAAQVKKPHAGTQVRYEEGAFAGCRPARQLCFKGWVLLLKVREFLGRLRLCHAASLNR